MQITARCGWTVAALTLAGLLTAGCPGGTKDGPPPPKDGPPPANPLGDGGTPAKRGYTVAAVGNGGTVTGTVTWTGGSYTPAPMNVTKDKKVCAHPGAVDQTLSVDNATKGVANVVVFIKKINSGKAWGAAGLLDNKGCLFKPQVTLHGLGSGVLKITNSDSVVHNTLLKPKRNEAFNKMVATNGSVTWDGERRAEKRPFEVACSIHGWMRAWIWIVGHPYHELSGKDGSFSIADIPAGSYVFGAWHGKNDEIIWSDAVAISAGGSATLNLSMAEDGTLTWK